MKYRLGLDMGSTSLGWAVYDIENQNLVDCGVRIFDDGRDDKSKASLCVKRRNARGARRLTDRRRMKLQYLLQVLTQLGLFPENETERNALKLENPYKLRAQALDEAISLYDLGRIFMQLAKRKGFRSSRKDSRAEGGKLKEGNELLLESMQKENARTYGELLYKHQQSNKQATLRLKNTFDDNGKFKGGLFPFRKNYEDEFNAIWDKQKEFYQEILTDENKHKIAEIIFFQRPLKEVEAGECQFEKGEKRIPRAHPLFQEFRIWQHVQNLSFSPSDSSNYEPTIDRSALVELLMNPQRIQPDKNGIISYSKIKKEFGMDKNGVFNFECQENHDKNLDKGLLVNTTQAAINASKYLLPFWQNFSDSERGELINVLMRPHNYIDFPKNKMSIADEEKIIINYLHNKFNLSQEAANELVCDICLEDGFASLSAKAINKILPEMKNGMAYPEACKNCGYYVQNCEHLDKLPYYGEILGQNCLGKKAHYSCPEEQFGRINNATVHVALNQVRHVVNELIAIYGKPYDLAVEYGRDLKASAKERKSMSDKQDANEKENKRISKELEDKFKDRKFTRYDIEKYKIWQNLTKYGEKPLSRTCPYSGKPISLSDLLDGNKFQIDHIIPFSRSMDDSMNNKVICSVEYNRRKGNRTPFEAFGNTPEWKEILQRAKKLGIEKQWRFAPDAMEHFKKNAGPIARSLNDTRYMTRLLQNYLQPIVREDGKQRVQAVVGELTDMVRRAWGLNVYKEKKQKEVDVKTVSQSTEDVDKKGYREFHNHHAVDAFVVAALNRGQIAKAVPVLAQVRDEVREEIKRACAEQFAILGDKNAELEARLAARKDIKDQYRALMDGKEMVVVNQYFPMPRNNNSREVLNLVENINISHKPNLKDIRQPNATVGQLHEDTAYGLQRFESDDGLKAIFRTSKDKNNTTADDKAKNITEYIPMFYQKADKDVYYNAFKEWFVWAGKSRSIIAKTKQEKEIKKQIEKKEQVAIRNLREAARRAFKWFVSGNNFCAEVYQINPANKVAGLPTNNRGNLGVEIVSNYNATVRAARGEEVAYWRYKYPNAKRIMTLRRNDMAKATFSKEQLENKDFPKYLKDYVHKKFIKFPDKNEIDVLFRVKKMKGGAIYLTPHDIAKEDGDTKSFQANATSISKYNVRKVHVSYTGRICNA